MAASSKWLVIDRGDAPVRGLPRGTLRKRLHAVWTILPLACEPAGDPERVHQLRVATRRALAAIEAFDRLTPRKRRQWFAPPVSASFAGPPAKPGSRCTHLIGCSWRANPDRLAKLAGRHPHARNARACNAADSRWLTLSRQRAVLAATHPRSL